MDEHISSDYKPFANNRSNFHPDRSELVTRPGASDFAREQHDRKRDRDENLRSVYHAGQINVKNMKSKT